MYASTPGLYLNTENTTFHFQFLSFFNFFQFRLQSHEKDEVSLEEKLVF